MGIKLQLAEPSPIFKPFIRHYKYVESDLSGIMKAVPGVYEELYFNFTHINVFSPGVYNVDNPRILLAGLQEYDQNSYSRMYGTDRGGGFAIVFQPQGFYYLFNIKSKDFCKYAVNGESVFKNDILSLWARLRCFFNVNDMKNLAEQYLRSYIKPVNCRPDLIGTILNYMEGSNGMIRVTQISNNFNISNRTLQRKFYDDVGLSPKELLHIFRINKAIKMMNNTTSKDLSEISYLSGYYDQSHFIRDIKRITGIAPGELCRIDNSKEVTCDNRIFIRTN